MFCQRQGELTVKQRGEALNEYRPSNHNSKKEPLRVFPLTRDLEDNCTSLSSIDLNEQATPRLQDPIQSFTLNTSNSFDGDGSMHSEDNLSDRCCKSSWELNPVNIESYPAKSIDLIDLNAHPETSSRTISSVLTHEMRSSYKSPENELKYTSYRGTHTNELNAATSGRVSDAYATVRSSSISNRSVAYIYTSPDKNPSFYRKKSIEAQNESDFIGRKSYSCNNIDSQEYYSTQPSKRPEKGKRHGELNTYNSVSYTTMNSKSSPLSDHSGIINNSRYESSATNFSRKSKNFQAKVEAFFWDPSTMQQSDIARETSNQIDLSCVSHVVSANSKDFLDRSQAIGFPEAKTGNQTEINEEPSFAQPMDQSHVIFEQSLSKLPYCNSIQAEDGVHPFDMGKFCQLLQRVKIRDDIPQEEGVNWLEKKQADVMGDTTGNRIELRKLMASPRSHQYKAFSPRIKDMPRADESISSLNLSDYTHNSEKEQKMGAKESHSSLFHISHDSFSKRQNTDLSDTFNDNSPKILCLHCEKQVLLAFLDEHNQTCVKSQENNDNTNDHSTTQKLEIINHKISIAEEVMVKLIEKIYNNEKAEQSDRSQTFLIKAAEAVVRSAHLKLNNKNLDLIQSDIEHLVEIANRLQVISEGVKFSKAPNIANSILCVTFCEQLKKIIEIAKVKKDLVSYHLINQQMMIHDELRQPKPRSTSVGGVTAIKTPQTFSTHVSHFVPKEPSQKMPSFQKQKQSFQSSSLTQGCETPTACVGSSKQHSRPFSLSVLKDQATVATKLPLGTQKIYQGTLSEGKNWSFRSSESVKEWSPEPETRNKQNYQQFRASFIQFAMTQKNLLESADQKQTILISDLVEEAFEMGLRTDEWEDFIQEKYMRSRNTVL